MEIDTPPLAQHAVHVWRVPLQVSEVQLAACRVLLSDQERGREMRFRSEDLRRRFAVARGRLREILSRYVGTHARTLAFAYGRAGKPALVAGDGGTVVEFNLSHSGEWALLAVSREMVGVDLEEIRELDYEAVGRKVLSDEELAAIVAAPEQQRAETFFRLWVRHEARLKALGIGLGEGPRPEIPVHDLTMRAGYAAAMATPLQQAQIVMLGVEAFRPGNT